MLIQYISYLLSNFDLVMFIVAIITILLNKMIMKTCVSNAEIVFRWMAFFGLGFTGCFAFVMHAFFPLLTAVNIGWEFSPFQFEVALANLTLGVLGLLSFRASFGFRLATLIASMCILWGDALGHFYQKIVFKNLVFIGTGSWVYMDLIIPLILLICIVKLRSGKIKIYE